MFLHIMERHQHSVSYKAQLAVFYVHGYLRKPLVEMLVNLNAST